MQASVLVLQGRRSRERRGSFLLLISLLFSAGRAGAQASEPPPAYKSFAERGFVEFKYGNFPEASHFFGEACRIYPNALCFRSLGMAEYEQKDYASAIEHLEAALADKVRPLYEEERASVERDLAAAKAFLLPFKLTVTPRGAAVLVDDRPAKFDADGNLRLKKGEHMITVSVPAYLPRRQRIEVVGDENDKLDITLALVASDKPRPGVTPEPSSSKWWLWAGLGVLAAGGAAVAIALAVRPSDEKVQTGTTGVALKVPMGN
jgi:tetratricopeptide (TPR) repeat protein